MAVPAGAVSVKTIVLGSTGILETKFTRSLTMTLYFPSRVGGHPLTDFYILSNLNKLFSMMGTFQKLYKY
jgi:hypothetical protein